MDSERSPDQLDSIRALHTVPSPGLVSSLTLQ